MALRTVMALLQLQTSNESVLQVAGDLVAHFDAHVIGVAASQPTAILYSDGSIPGAFIEDDDLDLKIHIEQAESEFWSCLRSRGKSLEWQSDVIFDSLANHVSIRCRSADIIVTNGLPDNEIATLPFEDPGMLILQAGRPVLLVQHGATEFRLESVVLAWRDTREARRAAVDALPFFAKARKVSVVEIVASQDYAGAQSRLIEVVAWLGRHDVFATANVVLSDGNTAFQLAEFARECAADLIVAGAYGHSRLREWVFGSVTHGIMQESKTCVLLSH